MNHPKTRLKTRRLSLLARDYLTYRALWPAIETAVAAALAGRRVDAMVVVDIGCGERPYANLFGAARCIGIDRSTDAAAPDVVADAGCLPLADACADLVFSTQVIEHVKSPPALLAECRRILRPGGELVLTGPFYWPLHEEPNDFFRFTCHGFMHLLRSSGFERVAVVADTGSVTQAAVSLIEALPRWALPLQPLINLVTPLLQRLSSDRRSTLNYVVTAIRPVAADGSLPGRPGAWSDGRRTAASAARAQDAQY